MEGMCTLNDVHDEKLERVASEFLRLAQVS